MHRSNNGGYGSLTASPSVFEENESCGDACARQLPSLEWIKAYDFAWLWNDVAGGITLGLVLLAQSLAHAHLCGVAPIRGPYACLLAPLAYALLGTCHEASIGTGGLVSLVVSEQLARGMQRRRSGPPARRRAPLLVGLVLCVMGLLRLAFLVRFLSRPALSGFISGSALLIIKSMSGTDGRRPPASAQRRARHARAPLDGARVIACLVWFLPRSLSRRGAWHGAQARRGRGGAVQGARGAGPRERRRLFETRAGRVGGRRGAPGPPADQARRPLDRGTRREIMLIPTRRARAGRVDGVGRPIFGREHVTSIVLRVELRQRQEVRFARRLPHRFGEGDVGPRRGERRGGGVRRCPGAGRAVSLGLAISLGVRSQVASLFAAGLIAVVLWGAAALVEKVPLCALSAVIAHAAVRLLEWENWGASGAAAASGVRAGLLRVGSGVRGNAGVGRPVGLRRGPVATSLLLVLRTVAAPNLTVLRVEQAGGCAGEWRSSPALVSLDEEARSSLVVRVEGPLWYANAERFREQVEELELFYSRRGGSPAGSGSVRVVHLLHRCDRALGAEEMTASWKRRAVHFYVASAYGQPKALLEAALGDVGDCSRTIDACLAAENASRTVTATPPPRHEPNPAPVLLATTTRSRSASTGASTVVPDALRSPAGGAA